MVQPADAVRAPDLSDSSIAGQPARSYEQLARYLELKSRLFDPDLEDESRAPLYDLALANGQLVATLNQTKVSLLTRLRGDRGQRGTRRTLQYYFVAGIFMNAPAHRIFSIKPYAINFAIAM